ILGRSVPRRKGQRHSQRGVIHSSVLLTMDSARRGGICARFVVRYSHNLRFSLIILLWGWGGAVLAQTTQGSLSGHVEDSVDGHSRDGALVQCENRDTGQLRRATADVQGDYAVLSLSPGAYRVRVTAQGYQPQEVLDLEIRVASATEYPFRLRPSSDVWEQR